MSATGGLDIPEFYYTPGQVATLFNTSIVTVRKWADDGSIPYIKLPGGSHRRYPKAQINALLAGVDVSGVDLNAENILTIVVRMHFDGDSEAAMAALKRVTERQRIKTTPQSKKEALDSREQHHRGTETR